MGPEVLLTVWLLAAASVAERTTCGDHEEYTDCDNHQCRDTCLQPDLSATCTYDKNRCYSGCVCKKGYLRDTNDRCVPKNKCTGEVEILQCTDPNTVLVKNPNICPGGTCSQPGYSQCSLTPPPYGCICKVGHLRDQQRRCIPSSLCPVTTITTCGNNEVFRTRTKCEATCDDPEPTGCDLSRPSCTCKLSYVRSNGVCIKPYDCPNICKDVNEYYARCVPKCPQACPGVDGVIPDCEDDESEACTGGCTCKLGYFRTTDGSCVLPANCPEFKCSEPNKKFSKCGGNCIRTCDNVRGKPLKCEPECVPGCVCRNGFVQNEKGKCIRATQCIKCSANEVFKQCAPNCPETCDRRGDRNWERRYPVLCKGCRPGCACADGFVRSKRNGPCITAENCPQRRRFPNRFPKPDDWRDDDDRTTPTPTQPFRKTWPPAKSFSRKGKGKGKGK